MDIKKMANLICKPLTLRKFKYRETPQPSVRTLAQAAAAKPITCIVDKDGSMYCLTKLGKKPQPRTMSCFICRQYVDGGMNTVWMCQECGMPLCQRDRKNAERRQTCVEEHKSSTDVYIGCNLIRRDKFILPNEYQHYKLTRALLSKKEKK